MVFKHNVEIRGEYAILEFVLEKPIRPDDLKKITVTEVKGKILLITGRGPIWLYGALVHHYVHLNKAIAVYDPKIGGYVVVASHISELEVGDVIREEEVR